MNIPNRATHEGRSLWTIDLLPKDTGTDRQIADLGLASAGHSPPLAAARLAGASRVIVLLDLGPRALQTAGSALASSALAHTGDNPAPGPIILQSDPPDAGGDQPVPARGTWARLTCPLADGGQDILYLQFNGPVPDAAILQRDLSVWPVLRRRCLEARPLADPSDQGSDAALLWMILSRIPAAVLVVNAAGLILRMNPQARRLIREGRILARGRGGLTGATDQATRLLRSAVKSCLSDVIPERFLLLPTADGSRVPATLARFPAGGAADDLATLLVPVPPEPDQVERVARSLGLTATEARVAALLQRGLSNRVAALCMGVQEQSFATYSKRVLSKLNLTSRAEIAQMLTWQSSLPSFTDGPAP